MTQIDNIEQSFTAINETLDRIEARIDNMNRMLDEIMGEIDKHKNGPSKTITNTHDGEIMFRYKRNKNNDNDESMYDINRSI